MTSVIKDRLREPGIERLRKSVRQDIFDENYVLQQYPLVPTPRTRLTFADLRFEMIMSEQPSERRPSVDLVQAAQAARKDIWRLHEGTASTSTLNREPSRERPKSAVDLIEAANKSRKARGERPLPVEPVRTDIQDPEKVQQTSLGSPTRYAPAGGRLARANAAAETAARRASMGSDYTSHRRSLSLDQSKQFAVPESPRPSTSGKQSRHSTNHHRFSAPTTASYEPNSADAESIAELASKFPPAPKSPKSVSRRTSSRRSRQSADSGMLYSTNGANPPLNDIQIMELIKPNGELHERYTTNTEDVEHLETQFAKAVIHEKVIPKVHNIITTDIKRHHHTHEIRTHIQPIIDRQYEPEKHWIQLEDGSFVEVSPEELEQVKGKYKYATRVEETLSPASSRASRSSRASNEPRNYSWNRRRETRDGDSEEYN